MKRNSNIALIGGDKRQFYIGQYFNQKGYDIYTFSNNAGFKVCCTLEAILWKCNIIILPIPIIRDSQFINTCLDTTILLSELLNLLDKERHILFGGCFSEELKSKLNALQIPFYDFMSDEGVAWQNCIATAEGAIMEAINESPENIQGSNCLVTGFGKCSMILSQKLSALGANVTIAARRHDSRSQARALGYNAIDIKNIAISEIPFLFVFNTVPAMIIDEKVIDSLVPDCTIIDIASYPGGTNFSYASNKRIKALLKLSIPGRISPKASGKILSNCIEHHLKERLW